MEAHTLTLLSGTLQSHTATIRNSEAGLVQLYPNHDLPLTLLSIAFRADVGIAERKAALTTLKNYVAATWASDADSPVDMQKLPDETKTEIRTQAFTLSILEGGQGEAENLLQALAANVVRAIASVDFPDFWPELLPTVLRILTESHSDARVLGALRVASELVDDGFTQEQFFGVGQNLISSLHRVAVDETLQVHTRAIAVDVFRSCWDMLETVKNEPGNVKVLIQETLNQWMPFFQAVISTSLPTVPTQEDETSKSDVFVHWKEMISLKVQVVKVYHLWKRYLLKTNIRSDSRKDQRSPCKCSGIICGRHIRGVVG